MNRTPEAPEDENLPQAGRFRTILSRVAGHFATMDLNPHEGSLRASGMPDKDLAKLANIPDYPPIHDDTLPSGSEASPPEDQ